MKFREYTIKIDRIREAKRVGPGWEYKDKMFCVDISWMGNRHTMFCDTTLKKAFKRIKEELYV